MRTWKLLAGAGLVLAGVAVLLTVVLYVQVSAQADRNCSRIHGVVKVGGEIIAGGKTDLEKYRRDGLLTQVQYDRAVRAVDDRLARWNSADCPTVKPPPASATP